MKTPIAIAAYAVIAIFTFGHASNNEAVDNRNEMRPMLAGLGCALWPFYWSWELQRRALQ